MCFGYYQVDDLGKIKLCKPVEGKPACGSSDPFYCSTDDKKYYEALNLYRGVCVSETEPPGDRYALKSYTKGRRLYFGQLLSTTTDPKRAQKFAAYCHSGQVGLVLIISLGDSSRKRWARQHMTDMSDLSAVAQKEHEMLVQPFSGLLVTSDWKELGGVCYADVELFMQGQALGLPMEARELPQKAKRGKGEKTRRNEKLDDLTPGEKKK